MSIEFFYLKEERTREEIVEEMKHAFGPSKGRMDITMSGGPLFDDYVIPAAVVEAMEKLYLWTDQMRIVEVENTSPNRLYVSSPAGVSSIP